MQERDESIFQTINYREIARFYEQQAKKAMWEKRATKVDHAIQTAWKRSCAIRVVVCDGEMRDRNDPEAKASHVHKRLLDPVAWAVTAYDIGTGECVLTRGAVPIPFVDQFVLQEELPPQPERRHVSVKPSCATQESARPFSSAPMAGASGVQPGFKMADGSLP